DPQASLPADYTFTAGDAGVHSFSATLKTVGTRNLKGTDTVKSSITGTQSGIIVQAAAAQTLTRAGSSPADTGGVTHRFTVAIDVAYANVAPDSSGAVRFTSNDPQATQPAGGDGFTIDSIVVRHFPGTRKTKRLQAIIATDSADPQ